MRRAARWFRSLALAALAILLCTTRAPAQATAECDLLQRPVDFTGPVADVLRAVDLAREGGSSESFLFRRAGDFVQSTRCGLPAALADLSSRLALGATPGHGLGVLPVDAAISQQSTYPRDWNNGLLRGGVGMAALVSAGAIVRWGRVQAALAPMFVLEENQTFGFQPFPDSDYSPFAHRWHGRFIDMPQQFGRGSRTQIDLGHSFVRIDAGGMQAGVSNQNLAWGPARRNALLLSGTAPAFPHVFVGTDGMRSTPAGDVQGQVFWGRLAESEFFDFDAANDRRALFGLGGAIRPRGLDGLYLGAGYLHTQFGDGISARDLLIGPFAGTRRDSLGTRPEMKLFGVWLRWAVAPAGLEVYGEWARQHSWKQWFNLLNLFDEPQAYTLGLQKVVRSRAGAVRLSAEFSHLADPLAHTSVGRGRGSFYTSASIPHGHTHRGQLLGAPIGPGSESQFIGADLFWKHGRSSLSVERARYDDDTYYAVWTRTHGPHGHDTEMSFRAGHAYARDDFLLEAQLGYSFRYSRSFIGLYYFNFPGYPYRHDRNVALQLTGRWTPPLRPFRLR